MISEEIPILQPNEQELIFVFKGKRYPIYKGIFYSYSKKFQCTPSIQQQTEFNADFDVSEKSFKDFILACQGHSFRITGENIFDLQFLSSYWGVSDLASRVNKIIEGDSTGLARLNSIIYKIQRNINTDDDENMLAANFDKYIDDDRILSFPIHILKRLIYSPAFIQSTKLDQNQKLAFLKKCLERHGKEASSIFSDLVSTPLSPVEVENLLQNDPSIVDSLQPLPRNLAVTCYIENRRKETYMDISKSLNEAIRNLVLEIKSKKLDDSNSSNSAFDSFDFSKSIKDIENAVALGDPEAEITLSYFYKYGIGVTQDTKKASELIESASQMPKEIPVEYHFAQNEKPLKDQLVINQNLNVNDEFTLEKSNVTIPDSIISPSSPRSQDASRRSLRSRLPRKSSFEMKNAQEDKNQKHVNFTNPDSPRNKRKKTPSSPRRASEEGETEESPSKSHPKRNLTFKIEGNEHQIPNQNSTEIDSEGPSINDLEKDKDKEINDTKEKAKEEASSNTSEKSIPLLNLNAGKADVEDNTEPNNSDSTNFEQKHFVIPNGKDLVSRKSIDSLEIDSEPDPNALSPRIQQPGETLLLQSPSSDFKSEASLNANADNDNESDDAKKVEVPAESSEIANDSQSMDELNSLFNESENKKDHQQNDQKSVSPSSPLANKNEEQKSMNNNNVDQTKENEKSEKANNDLQTNKNEEIAKNNQQENKEDSKELGQIPSVSDRKVAHIPSQNSGIGIFGSRRYKQICKSYDNLSSRASGKMYTNYTRSGNDIGSDLGMNGKQRNRNRVVSASEDYTNPYGANSLTSGSGRLSSDVSKSHMPYAIEDTANVEFLSSNPEAAVESMKNKCQKFENAKDGYKFENESEKQDITQSAFALGIIYWLGLYGIKRDAKKSIYYYELASSLGEPRAMFNLGTIYDFDFAYNPDNLSQNMNESQEFVIQQDIPKAIEWYEKASNLNNPFAQTNLGAMYYFGNEFLEKDITKAIELFEKAANQNDSDAETNLGIIYFFGRETEVNMDKAATLFESASKKDDPDAQLMLGIIYEDGLSTKYSQNPVKAVELYRKAAEQGNCNAQFDLGTCYQQGIGVDVDYEKVIEWYSRAAQNGHVDAMYNLAVIYQTGIKEDDDDFAELDDDDDDDFGYMIKKDLKKSLRYYKRAAALNYPDALFNLGILTLENDIDENENELEKDPEKLNRKMDPQIEKIEFEKRKVQRAKDALSYFKRAADAGCAEALFYLGTLYESGSPAPKINEDGVVEEEEESDENVVTAVISLAKDTKKAIECYAKAAELDHMSAKYNLAVIYTNGDEENGVQPNREKAIELFKQAAENGDADAEYNLKQLLAENETQ